MAQIRKTLGQAGSAAQLLGLSIAIVLLTPAGREAITRFGLPAVLLAAASVFLLVELVIVLIIHRVVRRSAVPPAAPEVRVEAQPRRSST